MASVSTNVFHVSPTDGANVTIVLPYQNFNSADNVSKFVISILAVFFLPAATLVTINHAISLHVRNLLMSVNNKCHVCKVSPYIPPSLNTSTTFVDVSHNLRHVQRPK